MIRHGKLSSMSVILCILCVSGSAMALDFGTSRDARPDNGQPYSLQSIFDDFTVGGDSSIDVESEYLSDEADSYWKQTATGQSAVTMIIEVAGFSGTNKMGIYDAANADKKVELFDGSDAPGMANGGQLVFSILDDGSVWLNNMIDSGVKFSSSTFGFYLDSSEGYHEGGGVFYSDTSLNPDATDHLAVYQGNNLDYVRLTEDKPEAGLKWTDQEFILAWEDLGARMPSYSDQDYNDLVLMIESVDPTVPVPEPGTLLLLGSGILAFVACARRQRKQ